MPVTVRTFGTRKTGEKVELYHLENRSGAFAEVTGLGAILVKLCVPDRNGKIVDVVLGYDDVESYEVNACFFGATIGRNGNRIANGRFMLNGEEVVLSQNENENNLHSGPDGFEKKLWKAAEISQEKNSVTFVRTSPDGENGFPGEFNVSVRYEFTEENELKIRYSGISDKDTVANLTNHSYFNLGGEGSGDILGHSLRLDASMYTPVKDPKSIPVGRNAPVEGTPMDFRSEKPIGDEIEADFDQLLYTGGYDHNFVIDGFKAGEQRSFASAYCAVTGIEMTVATDCPCVQFYSGNFINGEKGKKGHIYNKRDGFCLETQVEPDAVNNPASFHSPVLKAGERYSSATSYRFSVK